MKEIATIMIGIIIICIIVCIVRMCFSEMEGD